MNTRSTATALPLHRTGFGRTHARVALAALLLSIAGSASAQSGARSPAVESVLPPLPSILDEESKAGVPALAAPTSQPTVVDEPLPPIDLSHDYAGEHDFLLEAPALTESTGTWLRRGWWYTRVDAVVMTRRWDRDGVTLAVDVTGAFTPPTLRLGRSAPGREGSLRLTLGRFLFRDRYNRDHTAEFTFFGGGEFGQNENLISVTGGVTVPTTINQGSPVTFSGALETGVQYDSRFNSFEGNYVVTSRPGHDRMELQPNGEWVRRQNNGMTYHGLAGLRYMNISENLDWNAVFPDAFAAATGRYTIDTDNHLFGLQIGGGITQEWDRASITLAGKIGALANHVVSRERVSLPDENGVDIGAGFFEEDDEDSLPFLLEFGITGRWHMRPNVSIRAGYEMLFVTAVAQAPNQLNFQELDGDIAVTGDNFYHGISLGVEGYW